MIDTLTSLRLFFALMVFASHLEMIDAEAFSHHLLVEGYVGVGFFFVLSGFIIAYNYLEKITDGACDKRTFWTARVARIYPLHLLTMLTALAIYRGFCIDSPISWAHLLTSATLTNAFIPRSDFFFALNSPAWSLCCEQFFYFAFPFLAAFFSDRRRVAIAIIAAAAIILIGAQITPEAHAKGLWYTNPVARFPEFIVGIAAYHIYRKIKNADIGKITATVLEAASITLFAIFYINAENIERIYRYNIYYWLPTAAIILIFALQKGAISKILQTRAFIVGGEISFGIYLTHQIILNEIAKTGLTPVCAACVTVVATIVFSLLSWRYFEKPMNKFIKRLAGRR